MKRRDRSLARLKEHISKSPAWPALISGAEVYYFPELALLEEERLKELCIGESRYLMVELPAEPWDEDIYITLESMICNRKIIPVLAHIDRYFHFIKDVAPLRELIRLGMLVQLNVEALDGFYPEEGFEMDRCRHGAFAGIGLSRRI